MKNDDYVSILIQGLKKKVEILDKIIETNEIQKKLLLEEVFDGDSFEESIARKGDCIDELNRLDDGFTEVYDRVKDDLTYQKEHFTLQIQSMKELIQLITDKSVGIRVEEERNKTLAARKFAMIKKDIQKRRVSSKAANEYYKKMLKIDNVEAQFMDKKK